MIEKFIRLDASLTEKLRVKSLKGFWSKIFAFFAHSGDSWFLLAGLAVVWFFTDGFWHGYTAYLAVCIIILAVIVLVIKFSVKRTRPPGEWGEIYRNTDPHSFPSGHAARAVMLAMLAVTMGVQWFGVVMVIWAPLVVLARVIMGVHYLSDVLAGTFLGLLAGYGFTVFYPWVAEIAPRLFSI